MRVGVIQSNYLPWRGYFDFINSVDVFVFHDDLQYTKGDWRNRNLIKAQNGTKWLTVPVHYRNTNQLICDTEIDYSARWQNKHINLLRANYSKSKYFNDAVNIIEDAFSYNDKTISQLNIRLIKSINQYLGITTEILHSSDYDLVGSKTERLILLLERIGADTYLSGPNAKSYLDEIKFDEAGLKLEYKNYTYPEYQQQWGGFEGAVSILDLVANCGQRSRQYINSLMPDEVVSQRL